MRPLLAPLALIAVIVGISIVIKDRRTTTAAEPAPDAKEVTRVDGLGEKVVLELPAKPLKFKSARVEVIRDRSGKILKAFREVDAEQAAALAKFFPEIDAHQVTQRFSYAGWKAAVIITFTTEDGAEYKVPTNYDYWNWTARDKYPPGYQYPSDLPLEDAKGLEKTIDELLKH